MVLPNEKRIHQIDEKGISGDQRHVFGFQDFFHVHAMSTEHAGLNIITMEEFLEREALTGKLRNVDTGEVEFPPHNITRFESGRDYNWLPLYKYLRSVGHTPEWYPNDCALAIPSSTDPESVLELNKTFHTIMNNGTQPELGDFINNPTPVNGSLADRMREMLADREELCIYDIELQKKKLLHIQANRDVRLLTHFYAFIFFADWKQDLFSKRLVRDHVRIRDEIMCAAARVTQAVRERAKKKPGNPEGLYDALHIRRGDFKYQFKSTQLSARELYLASKDELTEGSTLYIATNQKDKNFFSIFMEHYDVIYLDDYMDEVGHEVNANFLGLIDLLVASKSRTFFGTYQSTFSGYINRIRGYYTVQQKSEGYQDGLINSWYFSEEVKHDMRSYHPVHGQSTHSREYPTGWRDIDFTAQWKLDSKENGEQNKINKLER